MVAAAAVAAGWDGLSVDADWEGGMNEVDVRGEGCH